MRLINYARQERQQQQKQEATRTSRPCGKWWKVSTSRRFCDGNCWMSWRLGGIVKPIFVRFVLIYVHGTICFAFRAVLQQWEPIKLVCIYILIASSSDREICHDQKGLGSTEARVMEICGSYDCLLIGFFALRFFSSLISFINFY